MSTTGFFTALSWGWFLAFQFVLRTMGFLVLSVCFQISVSTNCFLEYPRIVRIPILKARARESCGRRSTQEMATVAGHRGAFVSGARTQGAASAAGARAPRRADLCACSKMAGQLKSVLPPGSKHTQLTEHPVKSFTIHEPLAYLGLEFVPHTFA